LRCFVCLVSVGHHIMNILRWTVWEGKPTEEVDDSERKTMHTFQLHDYPEHTEKHKLASENLVVN